MAPLGKRRGSPADRCSFYGAFPSRPRGPGPIFWPDLFGDPTQAGAPHGWPTELPKREAEPVRQKEQKAVADSKKASEQPAASTIGAEAMPTGSMLAQAESTLRQRLGERERAEANDFPRQTAERLQKHLRVKSEQQAPFELTPATLRQAILYTEVLGPPRALRPYRPPLWK